ncbi:CaiB/BaiF CoA transferase family protein [Actinomadura macra]|uniref:CaiB/BaiF CoA transferase family protein n=1 Tax=Actinomadura macra TaxID=46164 RepID=UPI000ACC877F|nr:CoA transferase [Actinomadura macra]
MTDSGGIGDSSDAGAGAGALAGLLVADFTRVLAGPYATMLLADLGAEVVKVERPGRGDDTRSWGPPYADGEATYFLGLNRNKRSIALDLRDPGDLEVARALVARADVLIENFRPGTMERLGLGHAQAAELNPGLVYCSITGFGTGKGADLPGYDLVVQAVGGLMSVTGEPEGGPVKTGVALVDVITGLHAVAGLLAGLRYRDRTGQGQRVEVSLLTSLLSALTSQASAYVTSGVVPRALGNRHPSIVPYEVFEAADRPMVIAAGNDRQFRALCAVLERDDLARDPRFATNSGRVAAREPLAAALSQTLARRPADSWCAALTSAGVPCGPINDLAAACDLGASLGLEPIVQLDDPRRGERVPQVANPIRLGATPARYRLAPPGLGEHGVWVREILGR